MKYIDEYRKATDVKKLARSIKKLVTKPWTVMEICGGQTHAIAKFGLEELLPNEVNVVHGPGCPVCVTPLEMIDQALEIAKRENVIFCSFGDMLRVPGSTQDLFQVKTYHLHKTVPPLQEDGWVRFCYSFYILPTYF